MTRALALASLAIGAGSALLGDALERARSRRARDTLARVLAACAVYALAGWVR